MVILSDILGDEDHAETWTSRSADEEGRHRDADGHQDRRSDGRHLRRPAPRDGRCYIIDRIRETMAAPRADISVYAPRITTVKVKPEKVRDVIGSGGKNIRQIISETGVTIDVEDDGTVTIASSDADAAARAIAMVKWLTEEAEIGKIYTGTVKKVVDFGAFVEILPGTEGLVHISHLAKERVNKVTDIVHEGDEVMVRS